MKKIGITGSLASGKSTASKILAKYKGPLFSADEIVNKLYKEVSFQKIICKNFKISKKHNIKKTLRKKILHDRTAIKKLEKIIHPLVRKEMNKFFIKNRTKRFIFFEIPLLIESKLMKFFDLIIFIKANKKIRLKRFKKKGGSSRLFNVLNNKQIKDSLKVKFCDHVIVNENNLMILKKNLLDIFEKYE